MRMTRSGFGLLLGWLTEGVGGEAPGAGEGFGGDRSRRARMAVMHVINAHLQFDGMFLPSSRPNLCLNEYDIGLQ